jgi:hypothetical protein
MSRCQMTYSIDGERWRDKSRLIWFQLHATKIAKTSCEKRVHACSLVWCKAMHRNIHHLEWQRNKSIDNGFENTDNKQELEKLHSFPRSCEKFHATFSNSTGCRPIMKAFWGSDTIRGEETEADRKINMNELRIWIAEVRSQRNILIKLIAR